MPREPQGIRGEGDPGVGRRFNGRDHRSTSTNANGVKTTLRITRSFDPIMVVSVRGIERATAPDASRTDGELEDEVLLIDCSSGLLSCCVWKKAIDGSSLCDPEA